MNEVKFSFNGHDCPVLIDETKEPWWIAKNVCEILGLTDTSKSLNRLDDDEKLVRKLFVSGQRRQVWLVNEPGLYSLVLTSNKSEAKSFKRWITHEVLPSIRKTGSYALGAGKPADEKPARPSLSEAAAFMREARHTFGIRSARRVCKQYLGPENFEPLYRRPKHNSQEGDIAPDLKVVVRDGKHYVSGLPLALEDYRKAHPWYVSPDEEKHFLENMHTMTEEQIDDFIARAAWGKGIIDKNQNQGGVK